MTDPSDISSLAEHAGPAGDLPPPPSLRLTPQTAVFLDFDGTLVEIADHPDQVRVPGGLPMLITRLHDRLDGRLALVSGRSLAALDALLGPIGVAMAGSHGGEFRPAGAHFAEALAQPLPAAVVADLSRFAVANGGLLVEPKPFSVAVHYRHHPDALAPLLARAETIAAQLGLALKHGKQVIELAMPGSDKGSAVSRFMTTDRFAGSRPLFAGDDVTDEDAFRAVSRLGGQGVLVGPMRPTAACWRLDDVAALHSWLQAALEKDPLA